MSKPFLFDSTTEPMIQPKQFQAPFPESAAMLFVDPGILDAYVSYRSTDILGTFNSLNGGTKFYEYCRSESSPSIVVCHAPLGAPAAVCVMETLIANGVKNIVAVGSCGALSDFSEGEFLIPTLGLRDEGTSYHYLPSSSQKVISAKNSAVQRLDKTLYYFAREINHVITWTTDAFFRETREIVNLRKAEGCHVVDMEFTALLACSKFHKVDFGQIFYVADSLYGAEHAPRNWGRSSVYDAIDIATFAATSYYKAP